MRRLGKSGIAIAEFDATPERNIIRARLHKFDGQAMATADSLGLSRSAFYRRLEKYQLETKN